MQPTRDQQDPLSVGPSPTTVPHAPTAVHSASNGVDTLSSLANPGLDARSLFWSTFDTVLVGLQGAKSEAERDERTKGVSDLLAFAENRTIVWNFVGEFGIPARVQGEPRRAFVRAILPYVSPTDEQSVRGLLKVAQQAVDSKESELYKTVGERCRGLDLNSSAVVELAGVFARFETHSVDQQPCLLPWSQFFSDKGDSDVFKVFAEEIQKRVERREFSSFDHLVAGLCRTDRPEATAALQGLVDRQYRSEPSFRRIFVDAAKAYLREAPENLRLAVLMRRALSAFPVALIGESISQGTLSPSPADVYALTGILVGAVTVAMISIKARQRIDTIIRKAEVEAKNIAKENDYLESPAFLHLAEKAYRGLVDNEGRCPGHRALIDALESNELFADVIGEWRVDKAVAHDKQ